MSDYKNEKMVSVKAGGALLLLPMVALVLSACDPQPPKQRQAYPEMNGKAFQVYAYNCSHCHAPPQPSAHTAEQWPGVIARMDRYRIQRAYGAINAGDKVVIREYLSKYAQGEPGVVSEVSH